MPRKASLNTPAVEMHGDGRGDLGRVSRAGERGLNRVTSNTIIGKVQTIYEAAGADEGLLRLARAWHARVMLDEVVSHAFSHGFHPEHSERLAAYWAEALGGPTTFSATYGDETSVVRLHSGNGPHEEMDRRAIACFDRGAGRRRLRSGRPVARCAPRLFHLGDHYLDVPLPPVAGRCTGWFGDPALVLGWTRREDCHSRQLRRTLGVTTNLRAPRRSPRRPLRVAGNAKATAG